MLPEGVLSIAIRADFWQPRKSGSQEHISVITIMFCFNEFAFTVQTDDGRVVNA